MILLSSLDVKTQFLKYYTTDGNEWRKPLKFELLQAFLFKGLRRGRSPPISYNSWYYLDSQLPDLIEIINVTRL